MSTEDNRFTSKLVAFGGSIAIHVVIIALFFGGGSKPSGTPAPDEPPANPPVEETQPSQTETNGTVGTRTEEPSATTQPAETSAQPSRPSPRTATTPTAAEEPAASDDSSVTVYEVKKGDNLWRIAKEYGMTVKEISDLNRETLSKDKSLKVGQKIKVKVKNQE